MAIDNAQEANIAARRARLRQKKDPPLLIRDDGMLYPNTDLNAKKATFRPYYGDPKATLDDRLRFLNGLGAKRQVVFTPPEPFDVGLADKDALIQFAMEQYGAMLDSSKPLNTLRQEVVNLSELPDIPVRQQQAEQQSTGFDPDAVGAESAEDYARRLAASNAANAATAVRQTKTVKRGLQVGG